MNDEAWQEDAPEDVHLKRIEGKPTRRGTKGNRTAQWARWYARNRTRRNEWNKRHMAATRAGTLDTGENV